MDQRKVALAMAIFFVMVFAIAMLIAIFPKG